MTTIVCKSWWTNETTDITDWLLSDSEALAAIRQDLLELARKRCKLEPKVLEEQGSVWKEGSRRLAYLTLLIELEIEDGCDMGWHRAQTGKNLR